MLTLIALITAPALVTVVWILADAWLERREKATNPGDEGGHPIVAGITQRRGR